MRIVRIKKKTIRTLKAGVFGLMAEIPVITPVITAVLQVITDDGLSSKMDAGFKELGQELGNKMDKILNLQNKTIQILEERLPSKSKDE